MLNGVLLTFFYFYVSTAAGSIRSSNNTVSSGAQTFSNHGDSNLFCRPGKWPDVLAFFLLNYVAHAATVKTFPGESAPVTTLNILAALFFPASGVFRGFRALSSLAKCAKTDLEMAARAGALCTVIRWPPEDIPQDSRRRPQRIWRLLESSIHGSYELPDGYVLAVVPQRSKFENDSPEQRSHRGKIVGAAKHGETKISCSYNAVKILVALIQLVYATATLYQSLGDQIDWYGYSAFGLTVAPYAWMSFVNLCANLMCPEYPSIYLVWSEAMKNLQNDPKKPLFGGVVGTLTKHSDEDMIAKHAQKSFGRKRSLLWTGTKRFFVLIMLTGLAALPVAIIGSISRFQSGSHSTAAQQVSVTLWLLYGIYFGVINQLLLRAFEERPILNTWAMSWQSKIAQPLVVLTFLFGFSAVFGFIHVGQMLVAYGLCIPVS